MFLIQLYINMEARRFWLGCILIVVGVVLIFLGFYVEPKGELSGSLLGAVGEVFTLGGALVGADAYVEYRIKKMIHNKENKEDK